MLINPTQDSLAPALRPAVESAPKTVTTAPLAPNNYVVELVEQSGHIQFPYLAGTKVVCNIDGLTRKSAE